MFTADLSLEEIRIVIPPLLLPKLKRLGVKTIADIRAIDPEEFAEIREIGKKSVSLLLGLQDELRTLPVMLPPYMSDRRNTPDRVLPSTKCPVKIYFFHSEFKDLNTDICFDIMQAIMKKQDFIKFATDPKKWMIERIPSGWLIRPEEGNMYFKVVGMIADISTTMDMVLQLRK